MVLCIAVAAMALSSCSKMEKNHYKTRAGELVIDWVGHGSVNMYIDGLNIYVDPYGRIHDYSADAPADFIFVGHSHGDHFDPATMDRLSKSGTKVYVSGDIPHQDDWTVINEGERIELAKGISVDIVPAYNIKHIRPDGNPYHPKGVGKGFVFNFKGFKVYIADDTEFVPELQSLKDIDVAFLPMNAPTMNEDEFVEFANALKPEYLYPYHFSQFDVDELVSRLDKNITLVDNFTGTDKKPLF